MTRSHPSPDRRRCGQQLPQRKWTWNLWMRSDESRRVYNQMEDLLQPKLTNPHYEESPWTNPHLFGICQGAPGRQMGWWSNPRNLQICLGKHWFRQWLAQAHLGSDDQWFHPNISRSDEQGEGRSRTKLPENGEGRSRWIHQQIPPPSSYGSILGNRPQIVQRFFSGATLGTPENYGADGTYGSIPRTKWLGGRSHQASLQIPPISSLFWQSQQQQKQPSLLTLQTTMATKFCQRPKMPWTLWLDVPVPRLPWQKMKEAASWRRGSISTAKTWVIKAGNALIRKIEPKSEWGKRKKPQRRRKSPLVL